MDNTKSPPFAVMETSAIMLYLLKEYDSKDAFGFKDDLERNQCLQWLFFWHGSVSVSSLPMHIVSKCVDNTKGTTN
jgi:glutathione S-transferase